VGASCTEEAPLGFAARQVAPVSGETWALLLVAGSASAEGYGVSRPTLLQAVANMANAQMRPLVAPSPSHWGTTGTVIILILDQATQKNDLTNANPLKSDAEILKIASWVGGFLSSCGKRPTGNPNRYPQLGTYGEFHTPFFT
jgi:hypothetical protein